MASASRDFRPPTTAELRGLIATGNLAKLAELLLVRLDEEPDAFSLLQRGRLARIREFQRELALAQEALSEAEQRVVAQRTDRATRSRSRAREAYTSRSRVLQAALVQTILVGQFEASEILRLLASSANFDEQAPGEDESIRPLHVLLAFLLGQLPEQERRDGAERKRVASYLSDASDGQLTSQQALRCLAMESTSEFTLTYFVREALELDQRMWCLEMCVEVALLNGLISHRGLDALRRLAALLDVPVTAVDELLESVRRRSASSDDRAGDDSTGQRSKARSDGPTRTLRKREQACDLLGVAHDADVHTIRAARNRLARQHHPDGASEYEKAAATARMSEINAAYQLLVGVRET